MNEMNEINEMNELNELENENHNNCSLDITNYYILHISPVCFLKNYICFHNIKMIKKSCFLMNFFFLVI